jgi:hypothetical protein
VQPVRGFKNNTAAITAITTAWSALGDILFTTKADTTIAAIASLYENFCFIHKGHFSSTPFKNNIKKKSSTINKDH